MLRSLLRSCQSALKLHLQSKAQTAPLLTSTVRRALFTQHGYENNTIFKKQTSARISSHATPTGNEVDNDYVPYQADMETGGGLNDLIKSLRERFRFTQDEVQRIVSDDQVQRSYRNRCLIQTMDALILEGITKHSLVEYPWLLALDQSKKVTHKSCRFLNNKYDIFQNAWSSN